MTVDEMEDTLSRLGIEVYNTRGDEVQALCPAHLERTGKDDRNPSWYINSETGAHICFSCGWKGNLYSLISYVTGVEYDKANEWIGSVEDLSAKYARIIREPKPKIEEPTHVTESMLNAFVEPPDYALMARGLSVNAVRTMEIKWDERNRNWIIPIREPLSGKLLGWQEKGFDHRYFNNKPAGVKKSETLFGYGQLITDWAIVVESPLDVVRLSSLNYPGLAIYGASISRTQINYIRGLNRVIFAMDNDQAGRQSSYNILRLCSELHVDAEFFNYSNTDMKDVGAMSLNEIQWGIDNAKHIVRGEKAI